MKRHSSLRRDHGEGMARTGHCAGFCPDLEGAVPNRTSVQDSTPASKLAERLGLTLRQAQVLHWVAEGKTNEEIARILDLSFFTVKNHLKEIFQRLGVHSRLTAAACAYRAQIGTLSEVFPLAGQTQP
ncbi:MAG: helix-turn-helix transcriptional regulator [Prosthecobacter sp.]|jgi:DNA-binding CsgD family transcriptional regulator|uniref:helix-turn-helix domain-containing protein n=1 Tax=Prosthecobacter sp. TaxID=1965333 RepID=UPI0019E44C1D|nr:helix-turn-helix transcriptional regulator [Prosthecobacter sp.]MBE2287618.1 helix-turn-helix transcriptional regulator [Prosthecobacter sp.]